ncbi:MAG: [Kiritimatiellae bacterium]|nr:[FeFe] hydrogenase H-cluster maturation GTPase HydF [Kiritimatiellia bacterium]
MNSTPQSLRRRVVVAGRVNAGKSTFLNLLCDSPVALASPHPGTTTDPVRRAFEFHSLGPVLLVDTGGLDDPTPLGAARAAAARAQAASADALAIVAARAWGPAETALAHDAHARGAKVLAVLTHASEGTDPASASAADAVVESDSAWDAERLPEMRRQVESALAAFFRALPSGPAGGLLAGLVPPGRTAVFVAPIDEEAPKGRLILPEVQAIRAALDAHALALVVQPEELPAALALLREPPALVVCDSQAVEAVAAATPDGIPLTTFSILMARIKGDLPRFAAAARLLDTLRPGDRVVIAEACSHHPAGDDIGRVKLPRWLAEKAGGPLDVAVCAGRDPFPRDREPRLVLHCGGCMLTRGEMLARLDEAGGVPVTNYGVAISALRGALPRALFPFPEALAAWEDASPSP